jgi:hypothetical protein
MYCAAREDSSFFFFKESSFLGLPVTASLKEVSRFTASAAKALEFFFDALATALFKSKSAIGKFGASESSNVPPDARRGGCVFALSLSPPTTPSGTARGVDARREAC